MMFSPLGGLPQDHDLPQLAVMLDCTAMRRHFDHALSVPHAEHRMPQVNACEILWTKYKPGKNCTVCYRIALQPKTAGAGIDQLVYGRIYADGDGASRYRKAAGESNQVSSFDTPVMYIADLDMVVWRFPHDRKMRGLVALLDRQSLENDLLPSAVSGALGLDWRVEDFQSQLIHYVPEHTCAVKVAIDATRRGYAAGRSPTLYGKTYYNRAGARTYANMQSLWRQVQAGTADFVMAQPCAYHSEHRVLWQKQIAGTPLLDFGFGSVACQAAMPQAARAVAALHQTSIAASQTQQLADQVARLREMGALLSQVMPENTQAIRALVEQLIRTAPPPSSVDRASLHGDLHLGNILIDGDRAALIDLDGICRGPALRDVGSFAAALIYQSLLKDLPLTMAWAAVESFVREYQHHVPWPTDVNELRWHVAAALIIERAYRSIARLKMGRVEIVHILLEQASALVGPVAQTSDIGLGATP